MGKVFGFIPSIRAYFVDATGGSDSNDGRSAAEPWQTISKVNAASLAPGDFVLFKRGEMWREALSAPDSGTQAKPIVFDAYGSGADPIINGADEITGWTSYSGNTWQSSVTTEPNQVFMDNVRLTEGADRDSLNDHEWVWASSVLYVRDETGDPDGSGVTIESGARDHCIDAGTQDYIKFSRLHLTKANDRGFDTGVSATNLILKSLTVDYSFSDNVRLDGANTQNCVVVDCTCTHSDIGCGIIIMTSSHDNTIMDCICHNNAEDGIAVGGNEASGESYVGGANNLITGNTVYSNGEDGIDIKQGPQTIEFNECYSNVAGGIQIFCYAEDVVARYNNIHDNNIGFRIGGGATQEAWTHDAHLIYYNLVHNNADYGLLAGGSGTHELDAMTLRNNVFYSNSGQYGDVRYIGTGLIMQNNIFYSDDASYCVRIQDWVSMTIDTNCYYNTTSGSVGDVFRDADGAVTYTEAEVEDGTLYTALGFEEDGVGDDPEMNDPGNDDFTLESTSPCRNVGTDVSLTPDYAGVSVPQETNPAIGAYEYVA